MKLEVDFAALEMLPETDPIGPSDIGLDGIVCGKRAQSCGNRTCGLTNISGPKTKVKINF